MAVKRRKAEFVRRFAEAEGATPLGRHTAYFGGQDLGIPDGTDGQRQQATGVCGTLFIDMPIVVRLEHEECQVLVRMLKEELAGEASHRWETH